MVREIQIEAFLNYLGEGVSKPAVVIGDDAERYILKTQKVLENGKLTTYDCMFLNELLSYQIARYLGVPVPESAVAHLDKRLLDEDPTITFVHRFYPGDHFASLELDNIENNLVENYQKQIEMGKPYIKRTWNYFFGNIVNHEDIPKILAFDLLIANFDRYNNTGNLLISSDSHGRKIYSIDHGHAFFGPKWVTQKMNSLKAIKETDYVKEFIKAILVNNIRNINLNGLGSVFKALEVSVDLTDISCHDFQKAVHEIETISEETVDKWFDTIPEVWYIDKQSEIAYYKHFIMGQKNMVRHLIQEMAKGKAFSNYRGGELEWVINKRSGTA